MVAKNEKEVSKAGFYTAKISFAELMSIIVEVINGVNFSLEFF